MAVYMNAKGTTNASFQVGKRGGKVFGGVSTPSSSAVASGDLWFDNANGVVKLATVSGNTATWANLVTTGDDISFDDLTVTGNLTVLGTQTVLNTQTLNVEDNIITLNSNFSGADNIVDAGIEVERGDETNVSFLWDESEGEWTLGVETLRAGDFVGTLQGNVVGSIAPNGSPNTITGNTINAGDLNVTGTLDISERFLKIGTDGSNTDTGFSSNVNGQVRSLFFDVSANAWLFREYSNANIASGPDTTPFNGVSETGAWWEQGGDNVGMNRLYAVNANISGEVHSGQIRNHSDYHGGGNVWSNCFVAYSSQPSSNSAYDTGGFFGNIIGNTAQFTNSVQVNDYYLPSADGSANTVLVTDGAGSGSFAKLTVENFALSSLNVTNDTWSDDDSTFATTSAIADRIDVQIDSSANIVHITGTETITGDKTISGATLTLTANSTLDVSNATITGLTSDSVSEGSTNLYYSNPRARQAISVSDSSGQLSYNSGTGIITFTDSGLENVVEDLTPQLGGSLDLNSKNINGTGNINITGYVASDAMFVAANGTISDDGGYTFVRFDETSSTFEGKDLSLGSTQSVHVLLNTNLPTGNNEEAVFTIRSGNTTVDTATELYRFGPTTFSTDRDVVFEGNLTVEGTQNINKTITTKSVVTNGSITVSNTITATGTITSNTGFAGNLTGDVTGNVTGTVSSLSNHDTDDVAEGLTNLYYTDARVSSYLSANDYDTATNIVASITDSAPATLDTLNELAAALGDDANFSTTITNSIATKLGLSGGTMSGNIDMANSSVLGVDTLRINENGTGLRMTNVGAFDNSNGDFRVFSTGNLILATNGDSGTAVTFDATTKDATFQGNIIVNSLTYPTADGTADQVLVTDGNGTLSFTTVNANPDGSNTQVQFNNAGSFGASTGFTFDDANDTVETGIVRSISFEQFTDYDIIANTSAIASDLGSITTGAGAKIDQGLIVTDYGLPVLPSYDVASLPSGQPAGTFVFCPDEAGGPTIVFYDGSNWRRPSDSGLAS